MSVALTVLPILSFGQSYRICPLLLSTLQARSIQLQSGDALVFGGRARGIVHSVTDIVPATGAAATIAAAVQGRFNVNLREL